MDNLSHFTDEQLEKIISRAENTHIDGSQYLKAKNTLEVRRNKKLFEHQQKVLDLQEKIYSTVQTRLDRITHGLRNER